MPERLQNFQKLALGLLLFGLGCAGDSLAITEKNGRDEANQSRLKATFLKQIKGEDGRAGLGLAYWIELNRQGHFYRTSELAKFRSGDQIRFHMLPSVDAYTYIVMHQGTSGSKSVLFPPSPGGSANFVKGGAECVVPTEGSLEFDEKPGIEQVGLIISRNQIDAINYLDHSGAKSAHLGTSRSNNLQADAAADMASESDLEKAYDAVFAGGSGKAVANPGALEVLPMVKGAVASEKAERVLSSPSTAVVLGDNPDTVVSVDFGLSHN